MAGQPGFFLINILCNTGDATDVFDNVLRARDPARGYGAHNFMGYAAPRLDALLDQAGATLDVSRRLELLHQAMAVAVDDLPLVPLWSSEVPNAMRADVDWQPRLDLRVKAADIRRH